MRCKGIKANGQQCRNSAIERTEFCYLHADDDDARVYDGIVNAFLGHPQIRRVGRKVNSILEEFSNALGRLGDRAEEVSAERGPEPPPRHRAPNPVHTPEFGRACRALEFAEGERITEKAVKDKRRELAKKYHPDRGGDTERMAEINFAADYLLDLLEKNRGKG